MDLDALLYHYFGTADLGAIDTAAFEAGRERLSIDFGTERDPGRRFALWTLMYVLGIAPDADVAFKGQDERAAARLFARATERGTEAFDEPN